MVERLMKKKFPSVILEVEKPPVDIVEHHNHNANTTGEVKESDPKILMMKTPQKHRLRVNRHCDHSHDYEDEDSHDVDSEIVDFMQNLSFDSLRVKVASSYPNKRMLESIVEDKEHDKESWDVEDYDNAEFHLYDTILHLDSFVNEEDSKCCDSDVDDQGRHESANDDHHLIY
jgi:hypothetical protein